MAVDIAVLGLEVRSDGVVVASDRLKQLTAEGGKAEQATGRLSSSFSNLEKYVNAAQAAFAAAGIGMFVKSSIDAALQIERMNKLFNAATGSANLAGRELEYVRGVTNKLGLDLVSTTESYGKFMAAIRGTTLEGEKGRKVFESVSGAATALGLRADETAGVFKALEQMMSKGRVQAEELRGQLGERLPGAFGMAAKAMNMTTAELDKNLAMGKVMAEDLLPALAVQLEKTYGQAAVNGADSAQAAINRMNNAMLESKAALGGALMPVFTDFMTNVLTPIVKLLGDFVRMLQTAAATAAYVSMQVGGGLKDIVTGKVFTKEGYAESMADALENEQIYKSQMEKIWAQPGAGAYTAAEKARHAGNKGAAPVVDDKAADAAQKWASTYEQLRKEIDLLNPSMTELDRKILDVTQKYADLERKKGANIEKLRQLKAEHIEAIRTQHEMSEAIKQTSSDFQEYLRIAGEDTAISATADAIDEQHRAFRESVSTMDSAAKAAKDVADAVYDVNRAFDEAGQSTAIETFINDLFKLKDVQNSTADINISMADSDPAAQQMAAIEERYRREAELIQQRLDALAAANLTETAMYQALSDNILAMASKREQDIANIQRKQSEEGWQGVVGAAQKAFPKLTGLDKALNAVFKDHTKYRLATEEERAKGAQKLVKDETRSNLSMYSSYAGAAAAVFEGLAATQDTTSRKGFETAKALNMASAIMSTAAGIMRAYSDLGPIAGTAAAVVIAATGAMQIAQIASTSFGGGAKAPSVPSGSFGSGGAGGGTGIGNMTSPLMSIQDSQTQESLERLTASNENVATAIGRLSKSIDDLTSLFESGGAGYTLANNAPGRFTADNYSTQSVLGGIHAIGTQGLKAVFEPWTVGNAISSIGKALFGGSWQTKAAGFALSVDQGQIEADDYLYRKKSGGLLGSSKSKYVYSENNELSAYMNALVQPFINDMERMALTLGTTINTEQYSAEVTRIQTSGKKPEDIAKELEEWTLKTLQGMALTVDGLQELVGSYDDAYARLKEFNDALVSTNRAFELIGKTALQGSLATGEFLAAVQRDLFGGMEGFNEAIDTYFSSVFTDAEQEAALAAQAQRDLNRAFAEMGQTIPATRQEFRDLVNSLDITTVSGAQLFAALMGVSESFGIVMDAADAAAETAAEAAAKALEAARDAAAQALDIATGNLRDAFAAEKNRLTAQYNAELATLNEQLQSANGVVSTLTGYVNKLVSARQKMVLQDAAYQRDQYTAAQAMLAATLVAARSGDLSSLGNMDESLAILTSQGADAYANSSDYQRDFWQTKNGILELEKLAGDQLTDAQQSVALAQQQIDLLKTNHEAQLAVLDNQLAVLTGTNQAVMSIAETLGVYLESRSSAGVTTATPDNIESAVTAAYNAIGRSGFGNTANTIDASGYSYWVNNIKSGALSMADFGNAFLTAAAGYSDGYAASSNLARLALDEGLKLPGFAVGSSYIPYDMTANIHQGEMVIDRSSADIMRRYGIRANGSADNALVAELVREIKGLRQDMRSADVEMVKETKRTNKILDRVMPDGDALQVRVAA